MAEEIKDAISWPVETIVKKAIETLIPYARNARTHSPKQVTQIAASMREWGWTIPILIDEHDTIIAGHGRILAAQLLGIKEVPCMVTTGWTEAQKRAYIVADNKLPDNADWDLEMLKIEVEGLKDMEFDVSLTGFDSMEIDAILDYLTIIDNSGDEDIRRDRVDISHNKMIVSIGRLSAAVDYDLCQALMESIHKRFGEDDDAAIEGFVRYANEDLLSVQ